MTDSARYFYLLTAGNVVMDCVSNGGDARPVNTVVDDLIPALAKGGES